MMMGYGATKSIDNYFLAKATEFVKIWQNEAGLDPKTKRDVTGEGITAIVLVIVSLHLKIEFQGSLMQ